MVVRHRRQLAARRRPAARREPGTGLLAGRLRRDPRRHRDARRAGRRLQPRLGHRVPRRRAAAGAQPRSLVHGHDAFGLDRGRGRAAQPAVGRASGGAPSRSSPTSGCATARRATSTPRAARAWSRAAFGQLGDDPAATCGGYPQTLLFLLAYLFFNDGIQTVIYAVEHLRRRRSSSCHRAADHRRSCWSSSSPSSARCSSARLAARIGAHADRSWPAWCCGAWSWRSGYFLPARRFALFLGARRVLIGLVLGGSQALSRSLYSQLVPRGREAEYFSLYQAAERGTSWFGHAAVRAGLPAHRLLPVRHRRAGGVLRARRRAAARGSTSAAGIVEAGNEVPAVV